MRGLYRYLSPFTPDQSGAVSVLFELGGLIVICDAGGCAGNVCGFDEPRFKTKKSAVFSACLRDMDAVMGRDDKLIEKIGSALASCDAQFVAVVGTPVPSVIGTDYHALKRMIEKRFSIPALCIDTNGMEDYDRGEEKAFRSLIDTFCLSGGAHNADTSAADGTAAAADKFAGVWGATPLDLAAPDSAVLLRKRIAARRGDGIRIVTYGSDSTLADARSCSRAVMNYAVSPAGLKAAQYLKEKFGTPYEVMSPVPAATDSAVCSCGELQYPVLVLHQQFLANGVRSLIRGAAGSDGLHENLQIDAATFFAFEKSCAEKNDWQCGDEKTFIATVHDRGYRTIIADPLFQRALPDFTGTFIPLPHFAVSGQLYAPASEQLFFEPLAEIISRTERI